MNDEATMLGGQAKNEQRSVFEDKYRIFHTLNQAQSVIVDLRAQVERFKPKAEAYDVIARMWQGRGDAGQYAMVDPVYEIREMTERMEREFQREKEAVCEAEEAYRAMENKRSGEPIPFS